MRSTPTLKDYLILFFAINGTVLLALLVLEWLTQQPLLRLDNFLVADANHFRYIQLEGYIPKKVAFFPLAPYLWRALGLGVGGILALHGILYTVSALLLARSFQMTRKTFALGATLPLVFFLIFPYSECVFFLCGTIVLLGMKKDSLLLVLLGLFLSTLCRPAYSVFFPSLILVEILRGRFGTQSLLRLLAYAAVMALGTFIVSWLQWLDTGEWFRFVSVQREWNTYLQVPTLPFRTWGSQPALILDATSLAIGVSAMVYMTVHLMKRFRSPDHKLPPAIAFSFSYLAGITLLVLLFKGGWLFSLNRYILAAPFTWIALHHILTQPKHSLKGKHLLIVFFSAQVFFLLFRSFVHLEMILLFTSGALYLTALAANLHQNALVRQVGSALTLLIQLGSFIFATYLMLTGEWIG